MHDPLSDMLSQIRNAVAAGHKHVSVPFSKFKFAVAKLLSEKGYVGDVSEKGKLTHKTIEITLPTSTSIQHHKRISKPSRRVYIKNGQIRAVRQGHGTLVLSTPKGVLSGDDARKAHVGGEVLFTIW